MLAALVISLVILAIMIRLFLNSIKEQAEVTEALEETLDLYISLYWAVREKNVEALEKTFKPSELIILMSAINNAYPTVSEYQVTANFDGAVISRSDDTYNQGGKL